LRRWQQADVVGVLKPRACELLALNHLTQLTSKRIGREALILAAFVAFAVYATWPLVTNMFSSFTAEADNYQHAWMLWWLKERLFSLENPYWTSDLLAPKGAYLAYGPLMPLVGAVLAPITELAGPGIARNVATLAVPVLSAYVTYRLGMRLGLTRLGAVVTGGLYGFSTMLTARAYVHLNLGAGIVFAPLAFLVAVRYYQRQTWRNAVVLGGTLGAAVLVDQQTAIFAAGLAMAFLAAMHIKQRVHPRRWYRALALATITGVLVASPQLVMTFRQDSHDTPTELTSLTRGYKTYNASLLAMASPSPNLRFETPWQLDDIMRDADEGELVPAFGWGLLSLAVAGLAFARRRQLAVGLFAAFAIGVVLALGPEFTLSTNPHIPLPVTYGGQELSALMPYTWMVQIPFLDEIRSASRFSLFALLPATLLAGLGLQALVRRGWLARTLAVALLVLAVLEAGWPITRDDRQVPLTREELYAPVKAQAGDSIVVDVPLGFLGGAGAGIGETQEGMLRATEHGHPAATGYLSRLPQNRLETLLRHRFYADILLHQRVELQNSMRALAERFPRPDPKAGRIDARATGVGWVVIWPEASHDVRRYIRAVGFHLERRIDGIELYQAPASFGQGHKSP